MDDVTKAREALAEELYACFSGHGAEIEHRPLDWYESIVTKLDAYLDARDARGAGEPENEFDTKLPGPPRPMIGLNCNEGVSTDTPTAVSPDGLKAGTNASLSRSSVDPETASATSDPSPPAARPQWPPPEYLGDNPSDSAGTHGPLRYDDRPPPDSGSLRVEHDPEGGWTDYQAAENAIVALREALRASEARAVALREAVGEIKANIGSSVVAFKSLHERNPHRGDDAIRSLETAYKALTAALKEGGDATEERPCNP